MGEIMSEKLGKNLEQTASKKMRLLKLFWSTLYLSAFTFGGGYVIVSLMKKKFVDELGWIDEEEMLDLVAIAQSTPGAIAVRYYWSYSGDCRNNYSAICNHLCYFIFL